MESSYSSIVLKPNVDSFKPAQPNKSCMMGNDFLDCELQEKNRQQKGEEIGVY